MKIPIKYITDKIIDEYDVMQYVDENDYVYCKIVGAMYGLKQAGKIANEDLIKYLKPFGYYSSKWTPGLWFHETRPISFTLVVDNLGVKYTRKEDAEHLFNAIEQKYPIKIDWTGSKYIGIDIDWHYDEKYVTLSMKGYVEKALKEYLWSKRKDTSGPTKYAAPEYGKKVQYATEDTSDKLDEKGKRDIQQKTGKFLYYAEQLTTQCSMH